METTNTVAVDEDKRLSRRSLLRRMAVTAAAASLASETTPPSAAQEPHDPVANPQPKVALAFLLDALRRFPLVGIGDRHGLQEIHDFLSALLFHPDLTPQLTDIVVEFGNALHQDVADRFVLEGQPVPNSELQCIWRHTIGGRVLWDAPAYAQFFRTVRAVNWMRPPERRCARASGRSPLRPRDGPGCGRQGLC